MIDLYTWSTPNGRKVSILLEELGLDYTVHSVDIGAGDQNTPKFLKIGPNNKIPVFVLTAKNITKKDQDELKKYKLNAISKNSTDLSAIEVKLKKLLKNFKVKK